VFLGNKPALDFIFTQNLRCFAATKVHPFNGLF
jgi:hypothetical protein